MSHFNDFCKNKKTKIIPFKQKLFMDQQKIELRLLTIDDYHELKEAMIEAYNAMGGQFWKEESLNRLINKFPEGQVCIVLDGKVVGCTLSIIVDINKFGDNHTYKEITGDYTFDTHTDKGDVLYGIEIFLHPDYRGMRLGRRLYDARKVLCEQLNLKAIIVGGRIPNYHTYTDKFSPREYIDKVKNRSIHDPTLTFQLSNDFQIKKVLKNYLPDDNESKGYATLLIWHNVYYEPANTINKTQKTVVRIGLVQWQMRMYASEKELMQQVEYFVDAVSDYQSDFILFPELFNAPLMAEYNHLPEHLAIRELAKHTEGIVEQMSKLAVEYNVNIIAGSMPVIEGDKLYNATHFLHRNGKIDVSHKIHPTPSEEYSWGMTGGNKVEVIETDAGKIGVLVCYDSEFPELGRILAEQGMQILFVPFLTDTQNAYNRVRFCAQARAIENECFVAIAGNVGNLPKVNNMDLQFAQSAVFTPSDFAFPLNCIKAEASPNTEMIVVSDVDLSLLNELHEYGSVRNLKDRRHDLYKITFNGNTHKK